MKYIFIQDTFVSGTAVFAGETFVLNQQVAVEHGNITVGKPDLGQLKLGNRVVSFGEATEEHLELVEARAAYLEDKAAAAAKAPASTKKPKKSAAAANQNEAQ